MEEARELLVEDPYFAGSQTRSRLWDGLEAYLARFVALEERYATDLGGDELLKYLWLGGSMVSQKIDPDNIDLTVAVNGPAAEKIKGKPLSGWLADAFNRQRCLQEFGLSPLELRYRPIASVFRADRLTPEEQAYLRERGAWDDWWQRCRVPGLEDQAPAVETADAVRGYLEVTL